MLLSVAAIMWNVQEPEIQWQVVAELSLDAPEEDRRSAIDAVLADPAYFGGCNLCRKLHPRGHMHSAEVCQACAQNQLGVIY